METVVTVMMILVCFNYLLKQTCRRSGFVLCSAVVCTLFLGLIWPCAIEQSKSQVSEWLADSALMLDAAVVLTVEVTIQIAFCIMAEHIHTSERVKPSMIWLYRLLQWFPGILVFPVLFSLLVAAIFALPGISFPSVAWTTGLLVFAIILPGTWGLKRLLPEREVRLELLFLSNALLLLLGVIATVNGQTAVAGQTQVDWKALAGVMLLVAAGLAGGMALRRKTPNTHSFHT